MHLPLLGLYIYLIRMTVTVTVSGESGPSGYYPKASGKGGNVDVICPPGT